MNRKTISGSVFVRGARVDFSGSSVWEDYDERYSHDGGSYYQPVHNVGWFFSGDYYTLTVDDTSCGDFGSRINAQLCIKGRKIASAAYGSMDESGLDEYTDFCVRNPAHLAALEIATMINHRGHHRGYHFPYKED